MISKLYIFVFLLTAMPTWAADLGRYESQPGDLTEATLDLPQHSIIKIKNESCSFDVNASGKFSQRGIGLWKMAGDTGNSFHIVQILSVDFPCRLYFGRVYSNLDRGKAEYVLLGDATVGEHGTIEVSYARFGENSEDQMHTLAQSLAQRTDPGIDASVPFLSNASSEALSSIYLSLRPN